MESNIDFSVGSALNYLIIDGKLSRSPRNQPIFHCKIWKIKALKYSKNSIYFTTYFPYLINDTKIRENGILNISTHLWIIDGKNQLGITRITSNNEMLVLAGNHHRIKYSNGHHFQTAKIFHLHLQSLTKKTSKLQTIKQQKTFPSLYQQLFKTKNSENSAKMENFNI